MAIEPGSAAIPVQLLRLTDGLIVHQVLFAAATLGVADLLQNGPHTVRQVADELKVRESALHRILRALASQGIFEETSTRTFANTALSHFLRTEVPGSVRSVILFRGSEFFFAPFGEILYSIPTGHPAREKMYGMNAFEYLKQNPGMARTFDDAMTGILQFLGPGIAAAYDFGAWGSVMDIGGGNGILLAAILRAYPRLRGVLALPHVLERAGDRDFVKGELAGRCAMKGCDFFREVPSGCRAYVLKSVIHDWDDERAHEILVNCRRAVPDDGALLLVEFAVAEGNSPSAGKLVDIAMMVLTGGRNAPCRNTVSCLAVQGSASTRWFQFLATFILSRHCPLKDVPSNVKD